MTTPDDAANTGTELPSEHRLTLLRHQWYGMTMWPGYAGEAYHSPIQALHVKPLHKGRRALHLEFLNIGYAAGVQVMAYELRTLIRQRSYMLCSVQQSERAIALVTLTEQWLASHLPAAHNKAREIANREECSLIEAIGQLIP